jgi:hypothetical protein
LLALEELTAHFVFILDIYKRMQRRGSEAKVALCVVGTLFLPVVLFCSVFGFVVSSLPSTSKSQHSEPWASRLLLSEMIKNGNDRLLSSFSSLLN